MILLQLHNAKWLLKMHGPYLFLCRLLSEDDFKHLYGVDECHFSDKVRSVPLVFIEVFNAQALVKEYLAASLWAIDLRLST